MRLILIRHGESRANRLRLVTGDRDDPLTALGKAQVRALRAVLARLAPRQPLAFTSPWRRATESADSLKLGLRWTAVDALGETDAGSARNTPIDEFNKLYPDFFARFDPQRPYPEGESHAGLFERVARWIEGAVESSAQDADVLVATHNGPIACVLHLAFGTPLAHFPRFRAPNASVTVLQVPASRNLGAAELHCFGVTGSPEEPAP